MPFGRDPRQTIINRIAGDIESRLPGFDAQLPLSVASVLAIAHGIQMDGEYGYLAKMALNIFPWSVFGQYADRYAAWNGIIRKPPQAATGQITATGTNGSPIGPALIAQRSDGAQFVTSGTVQIAGGTANVSVTALLLGTAGNTNAGATLTLLNPPDGVNAALTVAGNGLAGGAAQESTAAMMARVQQAQQQRPQGGAASDYAQWGNDQAPVTRTWVLRQWTGAGNTGLMMVNDNADPITLSGGQLATIGAAIEQLRPVRGTTLYLTPTLWDLNPSISLDPEGDADLEAAVAQALDDLIANQGEVSGAVDPTNPDNIFDGGFYMSDINEAIKSTPGLTDFAVTVIGGGAPARRVAPPGNGQLAQLGTVTWV